MCVCSISSVICRFVIDTKAIRMVFLFDLQGIAERGVIQELLRIVNHQGTNDEENLFARTAVALALCGWKPR